MEFELIELSGVDSQNDNLVVTEEADVDEAIPIYLIKNPNKQAYKKTIDIDIENIDTNELRIKVNTRKWRPIYDVIDEDYFKESNILSDDFMQH